MSFAGCVGVSLRIIINTTIYLIESDKIWMRLLHLILLVALRPTVSIFGGYKILRRVDILSA